MLTIRKAIITSFVFLVLISSVYSANCPNVPACDGACVSLKAVKVNNTAIPPTNCVIAAPGDTITAEFYISGWGDELTLVRAYQMMVLGAQGAVSGSRGKVLPVGWDAPVNPQACQTLSQCHPPYPMCYFQGAGGICTGTAHHPELGAFIESNRPDYLLQGYTLLGGTRLLTLNYLYGMTTLESDGTFDDGNLYYAGTLKLKVSPDACGTFSYVVDNAQHPNGFQYYYNTLLEGPYPDYEGIVPDVQPLYINTCADDGIFCNGSRACDPVLGCVTVPVNCDDGVDCTIDSCDVTLDQCVHKPNHAMCDDGKPWTIDKCSNSGCTHRIDRSAMDGQ